MPRKREDILIFGIKYVNLRYFKYSSDGTCGRLRAPKDGDGSDVLFL